MKIIYYSVINDNEVETETIDCNDRDIINNYAFYRAISLNSYYDLQPIIN